MTKWLNTLNFGGTLLLDTSWVLYYNYNFFKGIFIDHSTWGKA